MICLHDCSMAVGLTVSKRLMILLQANDLSSWWFHGCGVNIWQTLNDFNNLCFEWGHPADIFSLPRRNIKNDSCDFWAVISFWRDQIRNHSSLDTTARILNSINHLYLWAESYWRIYIKGVQGRRYSFCCASPVLKTKREIYIQGYIYIYMHKQAICFQSVSRKSTLQNVLKAQDYT